MQRIAHYLVLILKYIASAALFAMMVVTFADVVGRYFLDPIFGAAEMIQFLLAVLLFAALGLASVSGSHITVDILEPALDRHVPRLRRALVRITSVVAFALIMIQLGDLTLQAHATDRATIVLEWPLWWVIGASAVMAAGAFYLELIGHVESTEDTSTPEETT